jgi:rSAM/selenodomain-associated transferase 1
VKKGGSALHSRERKSNAHSDGMRAQKRVNTDHYMSPSTNSAGRILGVFAKQPLAGQAKTRLAQETSPEWACRVAQAILEDSLDRFSQIQASRAIVYAPAAGTAYFSRLAQGRYDLIPQCDGDLGQRLHHFFREARRHGYSRIVAVGSDSPTLPIDFVEQAFAALEVNDAVIGPAYDGGYYLIGGGLQELAVFDDIPWSSAHVLEMTIQRVQRTSARLALLPPWYDVDTADDWAILCADVRARRSAGIDPGVPRVEQLMQELVSGE